MSFFNEMRDQAGQQRPALDARSLTVEVDFDFVCPWCMIGKRNLDAAEQQLADLRPDVQLNILWRSHQLQPGTPIGGIPYQAFHIARLGSPEAVAARRAQVQHPGDAVGIKFAFDRIELLPNTARAHALVAWAVVHGSSAQQALVVERLFSAYFMDGANLGDWRLLETIAMQCGLECADFVRQPDKTTSEADQLLRKAEHVTRGVPHFRLNGTIGLSGAHSSGHLLDAMLRSLEY